MKNRTYICQHCGEIKRGHDEGRDALSTQRHCDFPMEPLSHEQAYVATHLEKDDRLHWFKKGAFILKGPSKRKRWLAAVKDSDIEESKRQKESHKPKKPDDYVDQFLTIYYEIAEPYIRSNPDLLGFLLEKNAQKYVGHILFISVKSFRDEIYDHIRNYNLNNRPKQYLGQLMTFLISLVQVYDEDIEKEIRDLWDLKHLDSTLSEFDFIDGKARFPFLDYQSNIFSLRDYAIKCGVNIQQGAAPDG